MTRRTQTHDAQPPNRTRPPRPPAPIRRTRGILGAVAVVLLLSLAASAAAQSSSGNTGGCSESDKNIQCNQFGRIEMDNRRDINGEAIEIDVDITIRTTYENSGARWIMFSVRNDFAGGSSPVSIAPVDFKTRHGDVYVTDLDHRSPHELNLWVHVVDVPVDEPITLTIKVGSSERGAYQLETLVMPFDRGYETLRGPGGEERSLFAFTILGVHKESGTVATDKGLQDRFAIPGFLVVPAVVALIVVGALVRRRSK